MGRLENNGRLERLSLIKSKIFLLFIERPLHAIGLTGTAESVACDGN